MARPSNKPLGTRARAVIAVQAVLQGRSLDAALSDAQGRASVAEGRTPGATDAQGRASAARDRTSKAAGQQQELSAADQRFLQAMAYGVLRDWRLLQWLSRQLLDRPPRKSAAQLETLLAAGLFQLRSLNQPEHAVVHSSVQAARELRMDWAAGLVNAVLRRYLRERDSLETRLPDDPALRYSHPNWLCQTLQQDWPETWQAILAANNQPGPMWLRVNPQRIDRDAYVARLAEAGIAASRCEFAPQALQLEQPCAISELPGFDAGLVSIQDAAAQLAAPILHCAADMPPKRLRVLDACAAPGGKTGHLLELAPDIELLALDSDTGRLQRVDGNLQRLQLQATSLAADASQPDTWWDGHSFDRILLDAPCSGSGVIRRHPDIKWLRRAADIPALAARQLALLEALWPTLAPGGYLLFATCSQLQAEGDAVISAFLHQQAQAQARPIDADWGAATLHGRRIAAGQDGMDGFYYSLLGKAGSAAA